MNKWPASPTVYQINTWIWLNELAAELERPVTLGSVPQWELERMAEYGFDAIWLMGVWQRSLAARDVAHRRPDLHSAYRDALSDYTPQDIPGSPFAIRCYSVDDRIGNDDELAALRERLAALGLRLILDFVPNHVAIDHPWLKQHPKRFVTLSEEELQEHPNRGFEVGTKGRTLHFAHGRDRYHVWADTAQLDFRRAETREAMAEIVRYLARKCDGVRCDMAMLVTRNVFHETWGEKFDDPEAEFWPQVISETLAENSEFRLMAEVYWNLEYELLKQGFHYVYHMPLYHSLAASDQELDVDKVRSDLKGPLEHQRGFMRFVENHDEQRAMTVFGLKKSQAAALLTLGLPGMRLVHDGQIEGRCRRLPVELGRRALEPILQGMHWFYRKLLASLSHPVFHDGEWQLLEACEAPSESTTFRSIVAYSWRMGDEHRVVAANLKGTPAQCYLPLESPGLEDQSWELKDLLGDVREILKGDKLKEPGIFLKMPGYGFHLFALQKVGS